jgi:hypothetical protein
VLRFHGSGKIKCAGLIDTKGGSHLDRHVFGMEDIGQVQGLPLIASKLILPKNESMPARGVVVPLPGSTDSSTVSND